jgi:hypothetical protein
MEPLEALLLVRPGFTARTGILNQKFDPWLRQE